MKPDNIEELKKKFLSGRKNSLSQDEQSFIQQYSTTQAPVENKAALAEAHIKELEAAIARDLPGYHLVPGSVVQIHSELNPSELDMYIQEINAIISHDLPGWTLSQHSIEAMRKDPSYRQHKTFRVQPVAGGAEKIADFQNNHITVVQG